MRSLPESVDVLLSRRYIVSAKSFIETDLIKKESSRIALLNCFASPIAHRLPNPLLIVRVAGHAHVREKVRVLFKNEVMQVGTFQAEGARIVHGRIYELTILFVYYIMVHYSLHSALRQHETIRTLLHKNVRFHVTHGTEADADVATCNKIQLVHFL